MRTAIEKFKDDFLEDARSIVDDGFALRMMRSHTLAFVGLSPIDLRCLQAARIPSTSIHDPGSDAMGRSFWTTLDYLEPAIAAMAWERIEATIQDLNLREKTRQLVVRRVL